MPRVKANCPHRWDRLTDCCTDCGVGRHRVTDNVWKPGMFYLDHKQAQKFGAQFDGMADVIVHNLGATRS